MASILVLVWVAAAMIVSSCEKVFEINKIPIQKKRGECVSFRGLHYYHLKPNQTFKWHKYAVELNGSLPNVTVQNDVVTITKLTPSDSALYHSEVQTEGGKEITRYWLTVKDCDVNEKKTSLNSNCDVTNSEKSIACEAKCDGGWHYFNAKCFKYFSSPKDWENAHSFCQSANGARLATIDNEDENTFVGNLLQTGDGGWIGLNDKSQESYYIWNYQREPRPTYFAWDKSNSKNEEPNNSNRGCNVENCVELKYPSKRWNDAVCNAHFGYICQIYSKQIISGWKCTGSKCYKYNHKQVAWDEARAACMSMNATLVTITSSSENADVAAMIREGVWIGLNDRAEAGIYVWNDVGVGQFQNKATYFNWDSKEPNDKLYDKLLPRCTGEDCVQIRKWNGSVTWSDLGCATTLPFVCEKRKDMYISFAAWIALTMGAGLVISIVAARGYIEYKSKRGRKEVKAALIAENTNSSLIKKS